MKGTPYVSFEVLKMYGENFRQILVVKEDQSV